MARTGHQFEQLGTGPQKVDNLGNEKEEQCFAKVSQNTHHGKRHARKVAKGIAHKHSCADREGTQIQEDRNRNDR